MGWRKAKEPPHAQGMQQCNAQAAASSEPTLLGNKEDLVLQQQQQQQQAMDDDVQTDAEIFDDERVAMAANGELKDTSTKPNKKVSRKLQNKSEIKKEQKLKHA